MLAHSSVTQNINKSSFPNKCKKVCSNTSSCEYFSLYIKFKLCYKMLTQNLVQHSRFTLDFRGTKQRPSSYSLNPLITVVQSLEIFCRLNIFFGLYFHFCLEISNFIHPLSLSQYTHIQCQVRTNLLYVFQEVCVVPRQYQEQAKN